ncbi:MAG: MFS transporter [Clostridia bacterium]|nr:MFS transporter [Clostridia bacterium]MBR6509905.1 MFS transporter [Clostridia bacterium]
MTVQKDIYKTSRVLYIFEALVEYLSSLLLTGTFIAKVSTTLGVSDSLTGIITAFTSLGCGFELFSLFVSRKNGVKKPVIISGLINELLFVFIYVVPLVPLNKNLKIAIFVFCMLGGNILLKVFNSPKISWFMELVDDAKRGIFTSFKQMISLGVGVVFSMAMGYVSDTLANSGNMRGSFLVCAVTLFFLMVIHFCTYIFSKEKPCDTALATAPVKNRLSLLIKNKAFLRAVLVCVLYNVANYISVSFYGTYQLKELGFTLFYSQIVHGVYCLVRICFEPYWGKYADKYSFAKMFCLCMLICGISFGVNIFTVRENGHVMYMLYTVLHAVATAGINSALMNIILDVVPHELRSDALAIKNTAYGFAGFFTTLAASPFVAFIQSRGNSLFGATVYAQQILSLVTFVMMIGLSIYIKKSIIDNSRLKG